MTSPLPRHIIYHQLCTVIVHMARVTRGKNAEKHFCPGQDLNPLAC